MLKKTGLFLISGYQRYIRWLMPPVCRFNPSCSDYARQAIEKYGFFIGVRKALIRILYCHPFSHKPTYYPLE